MIHLFETDLRKDEKDFEENSGSFSVINFGLNRALKSIKAYSDFDQAEWVGFGTSLDLAYQFEGKKNFKIVVWETINTLPYINILNARNYSQKLFGMSNQITQLYRKYGVECDTLYCGCDTNFWHQTGPKNEIFSFLFVNSSNVRSGLDQALNAFRAAFQYNKNVQLIIKDTNTSNTLYHKIQEFVRSGCNITYITKRSPRSFIRDLYSSCHVCLNTMRISSFGFPLLESSACNCLCVTGDFEPFNEMIKPNYGILLTPAKIVSIQEKLPDLVNKWGLLNCFGGVEYPEMPLFYEYSHEQYTELLRDIYLNWDSKYSKIETRQPIIDNWGWDKTAQKLVEYLND